MAEKSALRLAREAAGLSRKQVAEKLGTTEHHYWHCEMPPFDGPADVLQAAHQLLQVPLGGAPTIQPQGKRADVEQPRGELTWRCGRCGHVETQPAGALEVWHICPKRKDMNDKRERLRREVSL
jgi:transcriptional regulator with XRE-family HTH domain